MTNEQPVTSEVAPLPIDSTIYGHTQDIIKHATAELQQQMEQLKTQLRELLTEKERMGILFDKYGELMDLGERLEGDESARKSEYVTMRFMDFMLVNQLEMISQDLIRHGNNLEMSRQETKGDRIRLSISYMIRHCIGPDNSVFMARARMGDYNWQQL